MLGWINKKVGNSSKEDPGLPKAAATASKKKKQVQLPDPPQEAGDEADSKPRTLISKRIKPGRKHDNAMMAFTKGLWMQDGLATLRHLLLNDEAHKRFRKHVGKTGAAAVDLSAAYLKVERMPEGKREGSAAKVLKAFAPKTTKDNAKLGDGFGTAQSERTQATSELWEQMASSEEDLPVGECYAALEKEAERALQMLSVHAFPSFVQSAACDKLLKDLRSNGKKEEVDALQGALEKAGGAVPSSADDWLSMFVQFAEQFPACIVISDMSIPGAPMVYVNDEFTRVTGYDREEVVGRNCRFLQGPDSEPESIHVIRSTLSKAKPCHVLVTNYRKNGEKFNNLLSMQPVFDSDGIYRFVIGVQFEVVKDRTLLKRMVVLDRLLRLLPTKLGVPSKEGAKRRMFMAARSDGSANKAVAKQKDWGETVASNSDGFDAVFAMTRMLWMSNPEATLTKLVADVPSREVLKQFVAAAMSVATQGRLDFVMQAHDLKGATASQARMKHIVMSHNTLFYCTNNEIEIGTMMKQDFSPRGAIMQEIEEKRLQSLAVLAETMFSQFMNSKFGAKCVRDLWQREQANDPEDERAIETVSNGARVDTGPAAWLNGFMKSVENLNVAVVVSDMTAPGLPLAAVNPAFTTITGYSQEEAVGRNCKFLQGPETEGYVVDEIIWALREAQPTCVKLHNYTKEGRKMQFLVCLQPVFGAGGEYRFQVAFQMEFNESQNMLSRLEEMEVAMCLLPKSTSASGLAGSLSYTGDSCVLPHAAMAPPPEREAEKAASAEADSGDQMSSAVEVAGRKNVDHYGRQFGNKHKAAMLEFSKSLWAIDSIATIGQILRTDHGLERFREFASSMEGHGCDVDLNFIHDAERIRDLPEDQREVAASKLIAAGKVKVAAGAVADESTSQATRALWDGVMTAEQEAQLSKESEETTAFEIVSIESDRLKKLLAMDAFPRFTKSRACNRLMADLKLKGGDALLGAISDAGGSAPPDADAWLNMFVSIAESYPACIVISDMTIPGCPMVYINNEFSRVTGYSREDVVGRNCRFLQGPDSEPESVHVIRSTLSQAKESHVLITNYRKNGEKFQNLLSMKPVFDADGVYRFVIGVQFEVIKDKNLKRRMIQLDKLLRMLPTQLGVASDEEAALRGELAARPDGTANLKVKEASKLARLRLGSRLSRPYKTTGAHGRPKKRFQMRWWGAGATNGPTLDFTASMVAFTKSMWLSEPVGALQHLLLDPLGFDAFEAHLQKRGSELSRTHLRFWQEAYAIDNAGGDEEDQLREMRVMHRRMEQNALFYCTTNEITIGNLGKTFWPAIANEMSRCQQQSVEFLAGKPLSSFLDSPDCISYIRSVRDRERGKVSLPVRTAAYGLDDSPSADPDAVWLGMFRAMAGTVRFGVVATDMNCPGLPLAVVNGGFELVTGVDPSQAEGRNCRFITGPKSEGYITDEIMDSLRHAKPLFTKLHNYKASGEAFQCVVTLNPVHTPGGAYKFMVGTQVDFDPEDQMVPKMLIDLERITRLIPQTTTGAPPEHLAQSIKEMDQYLTATTTTTA